MRPPTRATRGLGLTAAVLVLLVDQVSKFWLVDVFNLADRQPVRVAPFLDLVLAYNRGVSYSLLTTSSQAGRWALLGGALLITGCLLAWMWSARRPTAALSLGLIIGGALGNAADRWTRGAVVDFVFFHVGSFRWYVFNGADCAIVIGVALLLIESMRPERADSLPTEPAPKSPKSRAY
jgi:signal peptidase II